jgi:hypothetical protein
LQAFPSAPAAASPTRTVLCPFLEQASRRSAEPLLSKQAPHYELTATVLRQQMDCAACPAQRRSSAAAKQNIVWTGWHQAIGSALFACRTPVRPTHGTSCQCLGRTRDWSQAIAGPAFFRSDANEGAIQSGRPIGFWKGLTCRRKLLELVRPAPLCRAPEEGGSEGHCRGEPHPASLCCGVSGM